METLTELDKNQNVNVAQSVYDEPNFTIPNTSSKQIPNQTINPSEASKQFDCKRTVGQKTKKRCHICFTFICANHCQKTIYLCEKDFV